MLLFSCWTGGCTGYGLSGLSYLTCRVSVDRSSGINDTKNLNYMAGVNLVILLGNLGRDAETKFLPNGSAITSFSIATSYKKADGTELTDWHNVEMFSKEAPKVAEYLKKGKQVHVTGRIKYDSWEDKDTGEKKYKTKIVVNDLTLVGGAARKDEEVPF